MNMAEAQYTKAEIAIQNKEPYEKLQSALTRVFEASAVSKFLQKLENTGVPIRNFDAVIERRIIERVDLSLEKSGTTAAALYAALTVSDQAQIREFYLTALEGVDLGLREKFSKVYRYY
jgi:hypothetical protein